MIEERIKKMVKRIIVAIKTVYGKDLIYPIDENAKKFTQLTKTKTLSVSDLFVIEDLGFEVEYTKRVFIS